MTIPLVIAHRGGSSGVALENSLDAVRRALSYPADMVEVDIRKSRDNALYVMHDRTTGRTAGKSISIDGSNSSQIDTIRLNNGERVPTLADIARTVAGKVGLNLEIKSNGAGLLTAEYLAASGYKGYVLISSFEEEEVQAVRRIIPTIPVAIIYDVFTVRNIASYRSKGYGIISLRKKTVAEKLVRACHEHGVQVYVWTVDEDDEMRMFIDWGVDGIYTNRAENLKRIIQER